jgi:hypothetical protein
MAAILISSGHLPDNPEIPDHPRQFPIIPGIPDSKVS